MVVKIVRLCLFLVDGNSCPPIVFCGSNSIRSLWHIWHTSHTDCICAYLLTKCPPRLDPAHIHGNQVFYSMNKFKHWLEVSLISAVQMIPSLNFNSSKSDCCIEIKSYSYKNNCLHLFFLQVIKKEFFYEKLLHQIKKNSFHWGIHNRIKQHQHQFIEEKNLHELRYFRRTLFPCIHFYGLC